MSKISSKAMEAARRKARHFPKPAGPIVRNRAVTIPSGKVYKRLRNLRYDA